VLTALLGARFCDVLARSWPSTRYLGAVESTVTLIGSSRQQSLAQTASMKRSNDVDLFC
jgi:hypothetical protein